eukprot:GILK01024013.1.p1 GENE.GILK01024013.1~~GILK01024013.1.p1  ORF type:complete len:128 (-),score=16.52 GILK01024013.1:27-410(-)
MTTADINYKRSSGYVKLISQDKQEFLILRDAAVQSKVLKGFIEALEPSPATFSARAKGPAPSDKLIEINLDDIQGNVLDLISLYLTERLSTNESMSDFAPLHQLDPEKESDRKLVLDLLLAADFLEC